MSWPFDDNGAILERSLRDVSPLPSIHDVETFDMRYPSPRSPVSLSIAAPAYNEFPGIETIVTRWRDYLTERSDISSFEIVICDDGSRDGTYEYLCERATAWPELRVLRNERNAGAAASLRRAIRHSTGEWVLLLDTDGQFPIDNWELLAQAAESNQASAVSGIRPRKEDNWFNRLGASASSGLCNLIHGTLYRDFSCALKLIEGNLVRSLPLEARGMNYSLDLTSKLLEMGVVQTEVPIRHERAWRPDRRPWRLQLRRATDRASFVAYLGVRRALVTRGILQAPMIERRDELVASTRTERKG